MAYFKIIPYLFLIFAGMFLYEAITRLMNGEDPLVFFLFAGVAVFMFFFRRNSYKKFDNGKK
ncbi:MAG: hypothetical protein DI539_21120 [Flavobacterium psychrophilum]|nr:MAG: hypothetical protein DI539_21120 [Flavobacterium psychrophilum]